MNSESQYQESNNKNALETTATSSSMRDNHPLGHDSDPKQPSQPSSSSSSQSTTCIQPLPPPPLSWEEARLSLKRVLQNYLQQPLPPIRVNEDHTTTDRSVILSRCIRYDCDLYCGSVLLSLLLLILLLVTWTSSSSLSSLNTSSDRRNIYRSELIGAIGLFLSSLLGVWIVRRRRFLSWNDSEHAKRREVRKFLRTIIQSVSINDDSSRHHRRRKSSSNVTPPPPPPSSSSSSSTTSDSKISDLTSHTGVYPVYRSQTNTNTTEIESSSWSRIPSLLIVKGDWIALQVGDIAPAHCCSVPPLDNNHHGPTVTIAQGESITLETFGTVPEEEEDGPEIVNLPTGRTTLNTHNNHNHDSGSDNHHLLTLCNQMHVFIVQETPIQSFLQRSNNHSKPSLVARQIVRIRETLFLLAGIILILTTVIAFSRKNALNGDLTLLVHVPILAGLGILPVAGPWLLFCFEVLGTARILTTVHPFASTTRNCTNDKHNNHPPDHDANTDHDDNDDDDRKRYHMDKTSQTQLLARYVQATFLSRLSLWEVAEWIQRCCRWCRHHQADTVPKSKLVRVPPASIRLLEKLGVATALAVVDDELVCEPQSVPQQLLIPSGKGLKLLDLCQVYEGDSDVESDSDANTSTRRRGRSIDSDSESEEGFQNSLRRKILPRRMRRRKPTMIHSIRVETDEEEKVESAEREVSRFDVQFEEPNWWQFLPSLKCIGLACLLLDERDNVEETGPKNIASTPETLTHKLSEMEAAQSALARLVCNERRNKQLRSLAECIGFSTNPNSFGSKGDISPFTERLRLHILSKRLFRKRLSLDTHERSSEQSRWWGLIRPDATSVIVNDNRSMAYQLLTIGDPEVVTTMCNEAWQGEISTILPLASADRKNIIDTTNEWKLADLDVTAFSYSPVPHTLETRLSFEPGSHLYLLDNGDQSLPLLKDKNVSVEWGFMKNQVFLGVLGSLVVPRREVGKLLSILSDAGIRFVYFSPRNMRRQKELAIQMGIDVAWNCAISLRPLESGEDDPHRMVSTYADWDVNAKLPHGVDEVRKHLQEVDNVPLLVSLFTDATKSRIMDMIEIFQEYHDTVITVGLSHLTRNERIFTSSDIAVGIDILRESYDDSTSDSIASGHVLTSELEFVSSISANSCAFRFRGAAEILHISTIIEKSRAALEASTGASIFFITGCLSFSLFVLFTACVPSTTIPFVPTLGSMVYLLFLLPFLAASIAMGDGSEDLMEQVPPKNDEKFIFGRREGSMFYAMVMCKALFPALFLQLFHLIVFGELLIAFEPTLVASSCPGAKNWVGIVRCHGITDYIGRAKTSSGNIVFLQFVLCMTVASAGFVCRSYSLVEQNPIRYNHLWFYTLFISIGFIVLYAAITTSDGSASALPWYYYFLSATSPFLCLLCVELCKHPEIKLQRRAEKLRRLQFETRLGAWSPR